MPAYANPNADASAAVSWREVESSFEICGKAGSILMVMATEALANAKANSAGLVLKMVWLVAMNASYVTGGRLERVSEQAMLIATIEAAPRLSAAIFPIPKMMKPYASVPVLIPQKKENECSDRTFAR